MQSHDRILTDLPAHGEIGIEEHEDISVCYIVSETNRICFSFARLFRNLNHFRTEVNSDFAFPFDRSNQVAGTATNFEHTAFVVRKIITVTRNTLPVIPAEKTFGLPGCNTLEETCFANLSGVGF